MQFHLMRANGETSLAPGYRRRISWLRAVVRGYVSRNTGEDIRHRPLGLSTLYVGITIPPYKTAYLVITTGSVTERTG